jgi:signal transduction histidine kinase
VQNALDATAAGGEVWLSVQRQSGQVLVEVGDSGVGMSDEFIQTRLFRPFNSTKESGMGIGSHESLQYVRELGGQIEVDSQAGRGTVMKVLLPLFDSHAEPVTAAGSAA